MFDREFVAWGIALCAAVLIAQFNLSTQLEDAFKSLREDIIASPATGDLVIVEVDAQSLQAIDSWPWPRGKYGQAIRKLNEAGVSQIAFDIDFSSHSDPKEDQLFADAIAASEAIVILPTFRQRSSAESAVYVENLPIDVLAEHAFLGSVNVHPDANEQLNRYSYGTKTGGVPRPSLASMLSGSAASVDEDFAINQAIDPATIPRLSFADLIEGDFDRLMFADKKVMIGATAIELGDRYPIRRYGVIPGVVIQALATETLSQGAVVAKFSPFLALIAAAILLYAIKYWLKPRGFAPAALAIGLTGGLLLLTLEANYIATFPIVPMIAFLGLFVSLRRFLSTSFALRQSQTRNAVSGLPNEAAFAKFVKDSEDPLIIVARIANFRDVAALTNAIAREQLFGGLSERLSILAQENNVFHLEADVFGWIAQGYDKNSVGDHCDTASALFQSPFLADSTRLKLNAHFGASIGSIEQAKVAADQAIAQKQRWAWHDDSVSDQISFEQRLLVDLEQALVNGDIFTVFQPKWGLANQSIVGAEALVRWNHRDFGKVSPELFIPLLEREDKIHDLTLFVIKDVLTQMTDWHRSRPNLSCAINVSAPLLSDQRFVALAIDTVTKAKVDPARVAFEVTESGTLVDQELTVSALKRIRSAGIKVSIDDYGTGQSTLSYLQRLPADEIKIDQSFIRSMVDDRGNRVLVQSTIQMAHALGLSVVAEGVETEECLNLLAQMRCDVGQGWLFSKPLSCDRFLATLDEMDAAGSFRLSA